MVITVGIIEVYNGPLDNAETATFTTGPGISADGSVDMVVDWSIDPAVGNLIQSDSTTFDIEVTLNQL